METITVTLKEIQTEYSKNVTEILGMFQIDNDHKSIHHALEDYVYHYKNIMGSRKDMMIRSIKQMVVDENPMFPTSIDLDIRFNLDKNKEFILIIRDHDNSLLCALTPNDFYGDI